MLGQILLVANNQAKYLPSIRAVVLYLECVAALMTILQHAVLVILTCTYFVFANHGPIPVCQPRSLLLLHVSDC